MILRPKFPQWRPRNPFDLDPRDGYTFVAPPIQSEDVERLLSQTSQCSVRLPDVACVDPRLIDEDGLE